MRVGPVACAPASRRMTYQRNDLEYTFFRTDFHNFCKKISDNFCNFSQIFIKYRHFDITPIKFIEILWNSEEIRWNFDKNLQNLLSLLKFSENCVKFCEKWCKGPEKSEKSGMVQRKKCRARKTLKNATLDAKIGVDTAENEPRKGSEKCIL